MKRNLFGVTLLLACSPALQGCGDSDSPAGGGEPLERVTITGRALLPDLSPLTADSIQLRATAEWTEDGLKCEVATAERAVLIDSDGRYTAELQPTQFVTGGAEDCRLGSFAPGRPQTLRLSAVADATSSDCAIFCETDRPSGLSLGECVETCSTGNTDLEAGQAISIGDPVPAIIETNLLFDGTDPPLEEPGPGPTPSPSPSPTPGPRAGVDFKIDGARAKRSAFIDYQTFGESSCALEERCIGGTGTRKLLRFDTVVVNYGKKDFFLGDPADHPDLFDYAACHDHYHLDGFARYELVRKDSHDTVAESRKQGFCIRDDFRKRGNRAHQYDCHYQGLTAGWADVYDTSLECQWIDITDVSPGTYKVRLTVNPIRRFKEKDYHNNSVAFEFTIPPEDEDEDENEGGVTP